MMSCGCTLKTASAPAAGLPLFPICPTPLLLEFHTDRIFLFTLRDGTQVSKSLDSAAAAGRPDPAVDAS